MNSLHLFTICEKTTSNLSLHHKKFRIGSVKTKNNNIKSKVYRRWARIQREVSSHKGRKAQRAHSKKLIEKRVKKYISYNNTYRIGRFLINI